jgi:hypothetical protein
MPRPRAAPPWLRWRDRPEVMLADCALHAGPGVLGGSLGAYAPLAALDIRVVTLDKLV